MGPMCWFHGLHCLGVLGKIGDPPLNAGHDVAIAGGMQTDHEVDRLCQERTWIHKLEELQEGYERKDLAKKSKQHGNTTLGPLPVQTGLKHVKASSTRASQINLRLVVAPVHPAFTKLPSNRSPKPATCSGPATDSAAMGSNDK